MTYSVAVLAAVVAGMLSVGGPRPGPWWRPFPYATLVTLVAVGTVSTLQLTVFPGLLTHLRRDATAVGDGQVWRLVSAVFTQDGGRAGLVFNLLTLAMIGVVAEQVVGTRRWWLAFWGPALVAELVGLQWQPLGAGNSVGVAGLCGAVAVLAVRTWPAVVPAVVSVAGWAVLALGQDIHGAAGLAGCLVGLVLARSQAVSLASAR